MVPPLSGSKVKGKTSRAAASSSSHDIHNSTRISPLPPSYPPTSAPPLHTATSLFLDHDVPRMLSSASMQYATLIDKVNAIGTIPDPRTLELLISSLKSLSTLADERGEVCNAAMRELSNKRKDAAYEEQREFEFNSRERERERGIKKEPIDDEEDVIRSASKSSKGQGFRKRKQKDDRPLTHGAHHMARQDGSSKRHGKAAAAAASGSGTSTTPTKRRRSKSASPVSSTPSQSPRATGATAGGSAAESSGAGAGEGNPDAPSFKDEEDDDDDESSQYSHQPEPQSAIPHYQVFGPNPLTFDDLTVYHIRDVTPGMTDEEKKEIYSVARFPRSDLSEKIVGVPPDKDFSNTKPTNQVNATTFANYVEAFARPLGDQDLAFLKERGNRVTPFIFPRRGKQHYKEKWAAEDGMIELDSSAGHLPPNQGRGSIDQITDETAETDQVSAPPLISRLFSLLRFENHEVPELHVKSESDSSGGGTTKGSDQMDLEHTPLSVTEDEAKQKVDSAAAFPDVPLASFKAPTLKLEHGQLDERLKAELRYTGILGPEDQPDYDAHYDDSVADRLRLLQAELRKVIITNNARKARLHDLVRDRLAYQEYKTIHDDLDNQVQQAYLKRTRTLGKAKKGAHYKGRAGGHVGSAAGHAPGVGRPGIGDAARTLMDRRRRWEECIGPVIKDCNTMVPEKDESCFDPKVMADYEKAELERWDEEED